MNTTERARKLAALAKLFAGNDKPARALKPAIQIDLSRFSEEDRPGIIAIQKIGFYAALKASSVYAEEFK